MYQYRFIDNAKSLHAKKEKRGEEEEEDQKEKKKKEKKKDKRKIVWKGAVVSRIWELSVLSAQFF